MMKYQAITEARERMEKTLFQIMLFKAHLKRLRVLSKKLVTINQRDELLDRKIKTYMYIVLLPEEFLYLEKLLGDLAVEVGVFDGFFTNYIEDSLSLQRSTELKLVLSKFGTFTSNCVFYTKKDVYGYALNIRNFYMLCSELQQSVNHLIGGLQSFTSYLSDLETDIEDNPDDSILLGSDTFGAISKV